MGQVGQVGRVGQVPRVGPPYLPHPPYQPHPPYLPCRVRVATKRAMRDGGVVVERREMINQRGEVVQEAEYKLLVARRPPGNSA